MEMLLILTIFAMSLILDINGLSSELKIINNVISGSDAHFKCSYSDLNLSDYSELDIKWYFNTSNTPFLVDLPFLQGKPQIVDPLYEALIVLPQKRDGLTSFFILQNISTVFSGIYTCKVSTFSKEIIRRKKLIISGKFNT